MHVYDHVYTYVRASAPVAVDERVEANGHFEFVTPKKAYGAVCSKSTGRHHSIHVPSRENVMPVFSSSSLIQFPRYEP